MAHLLRVHQDGRPAFDELLGAMVPESWPLHQNMAAASDEPMQEQLTQILTLEDPRARSPMPNPMPKPHLSTPPAKHSSSPSPAPRQQARKVPLVARMRSVTPPRAGPTTRSSFGGTRVREDHCCDALLSPDLLASLSPCAKPMPLTAHTCRASISGQPPPPAQGQSLHRLQPHGFRDATSCNATNLSSGLQTTRRDRSAPR